MFVQNGLGERPGSPHVGVASHGLQRFACTYPVCEDSGGRLPSLRRGGAGLVEMWIVLPVFLILLTACSRSGSRMSTR